MWQAGNSLAASPLANSLAGFAREGNWRLRRRSPAHASRQLRRLLACSISAWKRKGNGCYAGYSASRSTYEARWGNIVWIDSLSCSMSALTGEFPILFTWSVMGRFIFRPLMLLEQMTQDIPSTFVAFVHKQSNPGKTGNLYRPVTHVLRRSDLYSVLWFEVNRL